MGSKDNHLHFVLFPFTAQGHLIPMTDIAKLLAQRGVIVTMVTTPVNAGRIRTNLARFLELGLPIRVIELHFPCEEVGLPKGCEAIDLLPSYDLFPDFCAGINMLQEQVEELFDEMVPRPNCMISDFCITYSAHIARKYNIPRISFQGFSCFSLMCMFMWHVNKDLQSSNKLDSDYFVLPGLPDEIKLSREQIPLSTTSETDEGMKKWHEEVMETDLASYGVIVNSFQELEPAYAEQFKKFRGGKAWCIGPVSLCNEDNLAKAERGNKSSDAGHQCLKWLDSQELNSVVYVSLGSICNITTSQLIELGLGLEASNKKFIWVIRNNDGLKELDKWIAEERFEERIRGRGFLVRGWAPQLLILSHPAIGGFLTHCGWNSTLEDVCVSVPLITWPMFGDQFCNEKLVIEVLKIGVSVGVERAMTLGIEDKIGVLVTQEDVKKALNALMDGEEKKAMKERAMQLGKLAKRAVEYGGSSYLNLTLLIQEITQEVQKRGIFS